MKLLTPLILIIFFVASIDAQQVPSPQIAPAKTGKVAPEKTTSPQRTSSVHNSKSAIQRRERLRHRRAFHKSDRVNI